MIKIRLNSVKKNILKNVLRYKWMYGGHMESHTVFLHTHDQKHLQNMIIFCFGYEA